MALFGIKGHGALLWILISELHPELLMALGSQVLRPWHCAALPGYLPIPRWGQPDPTAPKHHHSSYCGLDCKLLKAWKPCLPLHFLYGVSAHGQHLLTRHHQPSQCAPWTQQDQTAERGEGPHRERAGRAAEFFTVLRGSESGKEAMPEATQSRGRRWNLNGSFLWTTFIYPFLPLK